MEREVTECFQVTQGHNDLETPQSPEQGWKPSPNEKLNKYSFKEYKNAHHQFHDTSVLIERSALVPEQQIKQAVVPDHISFTHTEKKTQNHSFSFTAAIKVKNRKASNKEF